MTLATIRVRVALLRVGGWGVRLAAVVGVAEAAVLLEVPVSPVLQEVAGEQILVIARQTLL
jgi:hypothetical protein